MRTKEKETQGEGVRNIRTWPSGTDGHGGKEALVTMAELCEGVLRRHRDNLLVRLLT